MPCQLLALTAASPSAFCLDVSHFPRQRWTPRQIGASRTLYLAQHPDDGPTYDPSARDQPLTGYVDSDWSVGHSTSGWAIMYCGAVIAYGSKRQPSISLSSTEAEIFAASHAAAEIVYLRGLLLEMGVDVSQPTILYVDNKGAVELSKDAKSCQRSRHIDRRYLKVREWVAMGQVRVEYVETTQNPADALTKALDPATFRRHVSTLMGYSSTPSAATNAAVRQRTFDVEAAYLKGEFERVSKCYTRALHEAHATTYTASPSSGDYSFLCTVR